MLYDHKRWDRTETKPADVFSIESLIGWLKTMPAEEQYDFMNCNGGCLLGQYFIAMEFKNVSVGGTFVTFDVEKRSLPQSFRRVANGHPRTFAAALSRARAALGDRPHD